MVKMNLEQQYQWQLVNLCMRFTKEINAIEYVYAESKLKRDKATTKRVMLFIEELKGLEFTYDTIQDGRTRKPF